MFTELLGAASAYENGKNIKYDMRELKKSSLNVSAAVNRIEHK